MSNYYVDDVGTAVILDTGEDIADFTYISIKVKKPSGVTAEWSAVLGPPTAVGTYTKIMHIIEAGEWDEPGQWIIQAYVEIGDWKGHGDAVKFKLTPLYQ